MTLQQYLENINAKNQAEMDATPDLWIGMMVTDPEHWAEYEVYTVEDYQKYMLSVDISECSKAAYGSRYRVNWQEMSMEELQELADSYGEAAAIQFEIEREQEQKAVKEFENSVNHLILNCSARDRQTAIRWLLEAENFTESDMMYGGSYACYVMGLPYSYKEEFDAIMQTMNVSDIDDMEAA